MRSPDRAFRALPIILCDAVVPSFRLFGISQGRDVVCSRALYITDLWPAPRSAATLSLECSNTAVVRPFLDSFPPAFLWSRLTTELATGEYRGYGRAGTDDEGMMDVSLRNVQGPFERPAADEAPTRETPPKIGEGFAREVGFRHARSGHATTAPRN